MLIILINYVIFNIFEYEISIRKSAVLCEFALYETQYWCKRGRVRFQQLIKINKLLIFITKRYIFIKKIDN